MHGIIAWDIDQLLKTRGVYVSFCGDFLFIHSFLNFLIKNKSPGEDQEKLINKIPLTFLLFNIINEIEVIHYLLWS